MPANYARSLAGRERTALGNRRLGYTLTFVAGATNAGGFLAVAQYTSHMTGIVSAMADHVALNEYGLLLARERAGELARLAGAGNNLRAMLNDPDAANVAAEEAVAAAKRKAEQGSLASLFCVYVGTLQGRQSHYNAQSIFKLHVSEPFSKLAARPAAQVRAEELRDVLARLIDAGKGRTATKPRAYLRAAFGLAMRAGLDPTLPEALTAFDIQTNPADRLPSLAQFSKTLDRALTLPELHAFWRRVETAVDSPARDALMACMYLGGQRPTQLLRLTPQLVDVSGANVTLLDPKGRNRHANPRRHVLPIHEDLMPVIRRRMPLLEVQRRAGAASELFPVSCSSTACSMPASLRSRSWARVVFIITSRIPWLRCPRRQWK